MDIPQLAELLSQLGGLGALGGFIFLGYRVFQSSVQRSQEIDDETINDLRVRLEQATTRETLLQDRVERLEGSYDDLRSQFEQCRGQLVAVAAYMKLNHGVDPDEISGTPI